MIKPLEVTAGIGLRIDCAGRPKKLNKEKEMTEQ